MKSSPFQKDYPSIGSGPLALKKNDLASLSLLSHQLSFLVKKGRPDIKQQNSHLLLSLKSGEEKQIFEGEKIYLEGSLIKEPLRFAKEPTEMWITPHLKGANSLLIEVGMDGEVKSQFILDQSLHASSDSFESRFIQVLSRAKWWGGDLLFQKYGGEEYRLYKDKQKVECLGASSPYLLFVAVGDYIMWENGQWKSIVLDQALLDLPIAQIKSIRGNQMEIEVWDVGGGSSFQLDLRLEQSAPIVYRPEQFPTAFRLRSLTQVTCLFGKKRVILRQGDWLLKIGEGWHVLKDLNEIEDYLNHKIKGELFIFDILEKENGKALLKGNLFNEMRSHSCPVTIPVVEKKRSQTERVNKKHGISKRDFVSSPNAGKQG